MRVVIIPKFDSAVASLAMAKTELRPSARASQLKELKRARTSAHNKSMMKDTLEAVKDHGLKTIAPGKKQLPVTGAVFVDTADTSIAKLKADMPLHHVVPDYALSLIPPVKSGLAAVKATTKLDLWHLSAINLLQARAFGFTGKGEGITVAVLDTGIAKVPEIKGRVDRAVEFDADKQSWKEIPTKDTEGHGTHVAGLIAGSNVGVAPASKLVNVLMLPGGSGNLSDFILAIEYVSQSPDIALMNMSAGIEGYHPEMRPAITALRAVGVLPLVAVGNEGRNRSRSPGNYAEVVSVGASTPANAVASFSSGGRMIVDGMTFPIPDLVAPGEGVYSCVMGGGYEAWNGTSMATPIVSGIAALMIEKYPDILITDLEQQLLDACVTLGAPPERQGAGLAQVPASLWKSNV